jgi:hypothetical protein
MLQNDSNVLLNCHCTCFIPKSECYYLRFHATFDRGVKVLLLARHRYIYGHETDRRASFKHDVGGFDVVVNDPELVDGVERAKHPEQQETALATI